MEVSMAQQVLYIGGWKVPKLIKYDVQYNKLWSEDSGRDLTGENKATLVGFYPKIQVQVGSYTQSEMRTFLNKINKEAIKVDYYDEQYGKILTGLSYYANDYTISVKNTKKMIYNGFDFNLIPNKKRVEQ
jgi:hypothetical protein